MHGRRSLACLGALCIVALTRCASNDVQTSFIHDPLSAFPAQATFSWDAAANKLPAYERIAAARRDTAGPRPSLRDFSSSPV